MTGPTSRLRPALAAAGRVAEWTRNRYGLSTQAVVLVNEIGSTLPGFPPLYTVIVFWTGRIELRHHTKVFKPVLLVTPEDLPPYWMKESLAVPAGFACDCC